MSGAATTSVRGRCDAGFPQLQATFTALAEEDPTYNAQLAVYRGSELVADLTCGDKVRSDSLLPVFSCTKGVIGVVAALLAQQGALDLDAPVARWWPEFAAGGKVAVTVRQLLSHQAGLIGVDGGFTRAEVDEHVGLAARLARQTPWWRPGAGHGYHAITLGTLAEELFRRVSGKRVSELFTLHTAGRDIDVHLGVPPELDGRVAAIELPTAAELQLWSSQGGTLGTPADSLAAVAGTVDGSIRDVLAVNDVPFRRAGHPAGGGFASAMGLARMYAQLDNEISGPPLLSQEIQRAHAQIQVSGVELTGGIRETRFGIAFALPSEHLPFGSAGAFGHDGAGGALGYYDPAHRIGFGYTVQRIPLPGGADRRALDLSRALRADLAELS